MKALHINVAKKMLEAGQPVDIKLWKSNGEILHYKNAICFSKHTRGDNYKVKLPSGQIRQFRAIMIFEINDNTVYL